jgi:hypothetical protein
MIILEVEQGSQEWLDARLGIPTASEISCLLVDGKTLPPFGAGAMTYADLLVAERFRGVSADDFIGNQYTERGHELEPIVAEYYTSCGYSDDAVSVCGMILNDYMGASPDRLVGDCGGLEIKTITPAKMVTLLRTGKVDKAHLLQVQSTLWVSEREWWDYLVYCDGMPSYYERMYRDDKLISKISERVILFTEMVSEIEQAIINGVMPDKFKV